MNSAPVASMTPLPRPDDAVVFCEVEGGAVLLSTAQEVYFGLNPVGVQVWNLLPPKHSTVEEIIDALAGTYPDVERSILTEDVTALLDELKASGLVH